MTFLGPKRWPQKIQILCATEEAKELLMENGLTIQDKQIELYQPGATKVIIEDAPLQMKNGVIYQLLENYGSVVEVKDEHWYADGVRYSWRSGTRIAYIRDIHSTITPSLKLPFKEELFKFTCGILAIHWLNVDGVKTCR